jgi:hypothetical protein
LAGLVTQDAFDLAKGYADPYAVATFNVLNQVLIGDDRKLLGGQAFALAAATAPTITQHATGGTIGAVTPYVGVAGRTGSGYYYGSGNSQGAFEQHHLRLRRHQLADRHHHRAARRRRLRLVPVATAPSGGTTPPPPPTPSP